MKKLIIIEHEQLTPRTKSIWMFDGLKQNNIDFEYWDISKLCDKSVTLVDEVKDDHVIKIDSYSTFVNKLKDTDKCNSIFIDEFPFVWSNIYKRYLLHKYGCCVIRFDMYSNICLPKNSSNKTFFERIKNLKQAFYNIASRLLKLNQYKDIFSTSSYVARTKALNHPDYEKYVEANLEKQEDYIVFADEYFPTHPDFHILLGYNAEQKDIEQYHYEMRRLFDFLENKLNKKVVIAAHPKSDYKGGEFGFRDIIKNKTMNLIAKSSLVILHRSSSISYAVLADKPILITYTNSYRHIIGKLFDFSYDLSTFLEVPLYNLSEIDFSCIKVEKINEKCRNKYIYNLLTSKESSSTTNLNALVNYLQ